MKDTTSPTDNEIMLDTRAKIIAFLRDLDGESRGVKSIAHQIGVGHAAVRTICTHLHDSGAIQLTRMSTAIAYYIPNEAQREALENARATACRFRPLTPRTAHREALARAQEARNAYKSIG